MLILLLAIYLYNIHVTQGFIRVTMAGIGPPLPAHQRGILAAACASMLRTGAVDGCQ